MLEFRPIASNTLRIGTRKSKLALWQAEHVRTRLLEIRPDLRIELVKMSTQGDRILDTPLAKIGGKGLFIKELEQGLLSGRVDLAVHSTKDMPAELPEGLHISAILEREDPRDALVANDYDSLAALPAGARVGTSSLRRQCQLRARYPGIEIAMLRGNVNTRLAKLDAGEYQAIILAAAGLKRLGFGPRIARLLDPEESLPAVGQGAICIESRADAGAVNALLRELDHADTRRCVEAERALSRHLQGGCQVPLAGFAVRREQELHLRALVGSPDGRQLVRAEARGALDRPAALGVTVAESLLQQGARAILDRLQ